MPKTEEGEYELVLGSRQLLSIFFLVVVLLGVGFTLGYMLGRTSAPSPTLAPTEQETAKTEPPPPLVLQPPAVNKPSPVPEDSGDTPKAAPAATKAAPTAAKPEVSSNGQFRTGQPPSGYAFIQVAAIAKKDAELEAASLAGQGFPIWVAPNEKTPELFSVLVGPYTDKGELAKAKTQLEQLGFRKAFRKEIK
jgi:cell division septation protein DedD